MIKLRLSTLLILSTCFVLQACIPDFLLSNSDWVVIKSGYHEPHPKRKESILISPHNLSATVTFDSSCIYTLNNEDQDDWNKVIGVGFVGAKNQDFDTAPHQVDGARVGWRWNPTRGVIELAAYIYVSGTLTSFKVAETAINQPTELSIKIDYDQKTYRVMGGDPVYFTHNKRLGYRTGLYFGGNQVAPHNIRVKIDY
ncbi:MAG: hypothetical protein QM669_09450 [Siphonobacter sp.]